MKINYLAVVVAAVAAFVMSSVYYSPMLFGKAYMTLSGINPGATAHTTLPAGKLLIEFVRTLFLVYVLARFVALLNVVDWKGAVQFGVWVWLGFPAMLLMGSVMWQNFPWMLAAIHGGDWLVKILLIAVIVGVWRQIKIRVTRRATMFKVKGAFSGFSVNDLEKAKEFYGETLGLKVDPEGLGLRLHLPGAGTVFAYPKDDHQPATFTILNLVVDNIDRAVDELKSRRVTFERYEGAPQDERAIMRKYGPPIAWFKDPAGNILSVIEDSNENT